MDFDFEKFLNAPLNRRTKTFTVPAEMASFFPGRKAGGVGGAQSGRP